MLSSPFLGLAIRPPPLKHMAGLIASRLFPTLSLPSGLHGADVTHDPVLARAYDSDPLVFETANARWFTETQAAQARVLARASSLSLPLCVVQGTEDRVADLASTRTVFSAVGSTDKTLDVREGLRHEPLSEPEWPGVADFFAHWVEAHLPG
jgi:lysophospholipase